MVEKPIREFLEEIVGNVINPFINWIRKLSGVKRFIYSFLILLLASGIYWHSAVYRTTRHWILYYRLASVNSSSVLLSSSKKEKLSNLIKDISKELIQSEYPKKEKKPDFYNPWTISQIVFSTCISPKDPLCSDYSNYVYHHNSFIKNCQCWEEFHDTIMNVEHTVATSWVMMAFANLNMNVNDTLIKYIVNSQNVDGWWSLFPSKNNEDASTLSTAITILALSKTAKNSKDSNLVNQSVNNGLKWLKNQYKNSGNVFYDYPNASDKNSQSLAIYGLILHVINLLEPNGDEVNIINQDWLNDFKENRDKLKIRGKDYYNIESHSLSGHAIQVDGFAKLEKDAVINYDLPWFIIATIDTYRNASIEQKEDIISFLEEIIDHGHEMYVDIIGGNGGQPWLVSEFLIALRMINDEKIL
jgi:hypothetical protein